jgi:SAM-dependent methyltransferase
MKSRYLKNKDGIYIVGKDVSKGIGYNDGSESELLTTVKSISDTSTFSEELVSHMSDWPKEYHLSRKRHLILKPFNIKKGDSVLELGAGCGSITRYLAEIGAEVTAVEGEYSRALVGKARCKQFKNINFVVDDLSKFESSAKFDWILMIGVFEYSPKYSKEINPENTYLNVAHKFLSPFGSLIIAIENKLGIKYFNGASEDHNGVKLYGPHDLYHQNDITTWGRVELSDKLKSNGFNDVTFRGVFPDYKLPKVIFNEEINNQLNFRAEELILYTKSLDYTNNNNRFFDEALLASSLRKNKLLIDFSNSFLIEAKIDKFSEETKNEKILAYYYSVDRKKQFITETLFTSDNSNLQVKKGHLFDQNLIEKRSIYLTDVHGSLYLINQDFNSNKDKYKLGRSLAYLYAQANSRDNFQQIDEIISLWISHLKNNFKFYDYKSNLIIDLNTNSITEKKLKLDSILIDGAAIDCGLQNIIYNDFCEDFDLEWKCLKPVPLSWVLTRNANHIIRNGHYKKSIITIENIIGLASDKLNLEAVLDDVVNSYYIENQFQKEVGYNEPSNFINLSGVIA